MRIGIIGFGFMGGVHLSAIEQIKDATLTAVSSRTRPTADTPVRGNLPQLKSGTLPSEVKWFDDWRELLQAPDIDAVDICLPTHLHKVVAISALERGKHVLCEKPMALTPSDCDEILEAANKSGCTFMVGQVLRFMFPYRYAASFVDSMGRGAIKACTMKRKTGYPQWSEWLSNEVNSGGAILDLLSHDIDQALKLFGQPDTVSAVMHGEIDTMLGTFRYSDGLKVQIEGGWYTPEVLFSAGFEIEGEDAGITFEDGKLQREVHGTKEIVTIPEHQEYLEQISYFIECCRNNTAPELCPPAESARAVKSSYPSQGIERPGWKGVGMRDIKAMEIGLVFWAEPDTEAVLRRLRTLDIHCGQLGVPPDLDCDTALNDWANGLNKFEVSVSSAVCSYMGEDYSNLETVHKTVGFTAEALRPDRIARTKAVSEFARTLGLSALSCHIGFIPGDPDESLYKDLCELTKLLCDYCGDRGQDFVLETGQESAEVLHSFIHNVERKNLKVNFDPANMIMYQAGDPLAALKLLSPHVLSVHCKDAHSSAGTGLLGSECALGDGEVNFPAFLQQLKEMKYQGLLSIEREELDLEKRNADIKTGISRLKQWKMELGL